MIVSYNFYYARPGNAAAVLRQRLQASDVRAQLGLHGDAPISKVEGGGEWPDVIWRLDFAITAAQDTAMKARAESPEFEAIRHGMRQRYQRFERPLYAPFSQDTSPPGIEPQQSILLFGVYCDASVNAAARAVLGRVQAVEFISGGTDVPRILDETGIAGLPTDVDESGSLAGAFATKRLENGGSRRSGDPAVNIKNV